MLRNYFQTAIRILLKERFYTIINILGLAVGLASCFMIYLWVKSEMSFDSYAGSENIYRVITKQDESPEAGIASTYPMMKNRVLAQFPEVEQCVRIFDQGFLGSITRVTYRDKIFIDNRFYYGDPNFLAIFPFRVLRGDPTTCLAKSNAVVITESTAKKIFGDEDPIGKTIRVGVDFDYEVTAILENIPLNNHFHFDMLASMESHPWIKQAENNVWSGVVFHTYVKLREGSSAADLQNKLTDFMDNFPNDPKGIGKSHDFRLQPIQDIHLNSDYKFELEENGNIDYVYMFVTISLLVLVVAIINYINLTTARHSQRLKEVGVRKILGAGRKQLIAQLVTESFIVITMAFSFSILITIIARPFLISVAGSVFLGANIWNQEIFITVILITAFIGLITGVLPGVMLSAFKPVHLFKAGLINSSKGTNLRKVLVVSQFAASIALTICTAIIYKQIRFIKETDLGYDKDHTIVLNIGFAEVKKQYQSLKGLLAQHASILGTTATSQLPTDIQTAENIDAPPSQSEGVYCISVDPEFFNVMGIRINNGSELIHAIVPSDSLNYFVINESAQDKLGWSESETINRMISIRHGNQKPGPIKGIVQDFHFQSFHHGISPLVFEFNPVDYQYLLVKIKPEQVEETLAYIQDVWKKFAGSIPFDYQFLDQKYDNLYRTESRSSKLFMIFSVVTVFTSLLGLFGLSAFAAERRTKEIGVRKILGAGVSNIITLTSKDFILLLSIAFVVAVPVAYYFMESWLSNFAFRVAIDLSTLFFAGLVNFVLAMSTLAYHIIRISQINPVDTLKYE